MMHTKLRIYIFALSINRNYEAYISKEALKNIENNFGISNLENSKSLYAIISFDHAVLHTQIHAWTQRRWDSFTTSANSAVAIFISIVIGCCWKLYISSMWIIITILVFLVLVYHAFISWRQTMQMIEFQSSGPFPKCDMSEPNKTASAGKRKDC
ncbi:MAG: hypothetical protein SVS15_07795 [Thermodesulfobacteriota bacterium]|nr:hypothetical protein [Thermodesulfobacteriota bacterium]